MKQILFFTLLVFQTVVFSQSEAVNGTYHYNFDGSNGAFGERITLRANGTFEIYTFKKLDGSHQAEEHSYDRGIWKLKTNIVRF